MRTFFTLSILLLAAAAARAEDPLVVLAAARTGHIEFFDANLSPLGAIGVNQLVESVTARIVRSAFAGRPLSLHPRRSGSRYLQRQNVAPPSHHDRARHLQPATFA